MKTDARTRYTKQVLRSSLLKLMENKPIKSITVKEVCELAELNRATFYAHYKDCYDLLEQIENELIADFVSSLKYISFSDVTELIIAIFDMVDRNTDLCKLLFFEHTDDAIIKKMIAIARDSSLDFWKAHLPKASDAYLDLLFTCLANGLLHVFIEGYPKYDRKTLIAFINTMVKSSMAAYL